MSNAITNNSTVQTRLIGVGSELRAAVTGRDQRSRYARLRSGKRLHPAHRCAPAASCAAGAPAAAMPGAMRFDRWPTSVDGGVLPALVADLDLPAAAWATLVIARAISA